VKYLPKTDIKGANGVATVRDIFRGVRMDLATIKSDTNGRNKGNTAHSIDTSSQSERLFRDALQERSGIVFEHNVRPIWLKNPLTSNPLELDLFCEARKLAIEYDGHHHYVFPNSIHKDNEAEFRAQQARDAAKDEICLQKGVRLIRVRCGEGTDAEVRWCMAEMEKPWP
jgi:hypothetical protein